MDIEIQTPISPMIAEVLYTILANTFYIHLEIDSEMISIFLLEIFHLYVATFQKHMYTEYISLP